MVSLIGLLVLGAPIEDITEASLDDLLNDEVTVASTISHTVREAPGVLSVISREDLVESGARDLIDALRMVPGLEFGSDVQGVVGLGFRGIWGHEGKILLLIDGLPMNELSYSSLHFGNEMDLDSVERIEVVRGPGSVVYGGFAELAVVNVVTRSARDLAPEGRAGLHAGARYAQAKGAIGQRNLSLSASTSHPEVGAHGRVHAMVGQANRSDQRYVDLAGNSYDMGGDAAMNPIQVNAEADFRGLELHLLYDQYGSSTRDSYTDVSPERLPNDFTTLLAEAHYQLEPTEWVRIVPRFIYSRQAPWHNDDQALAGTALYYDTVVERYTGSVATVVSPIERLDVTAGLEAYHDRAIVSSFMKDRYGKTSFDNLAVFAEAAADLDVVSASAGARFEAHSQFGRSFVPRLALTKVLGDFHVKALASQAFRAPSLENLALQPDIKPERTTAYELEVGYRLNRLMFVSANVFDVTLARPIVYFYDDATEEEGYKNRGKTGSSGGELELRMGIGALSTRLSYAYYTTRAFLFGAPKNHIDEYATPDGEALLGFAPHKLGFDATFRPLEHASVNLTSSLYSARYAYTSLDANGVPLTQRMRPIALVNLFARYENVLVDGLSFGAGVFDIFHQRNHVFIQPYASGHAPLPMSGREVVVKADYEATF